MINYIEIEDKNPSSLTEKFQIIKTATGYSHGCFILIGNF